MSEAVTYEQRGNVALITIRRAERKNAFDDSVVFGLEKAWQRYAESEERAAVLTSEGTDSFTVGADLRALPPEIWRSVPGVSVEIGKPLICAVFGHCIGVGVALVQAADLCVAAESTRFTYAEPKIGFAYGLITALASRIPHKIAMEMMLLGRPIGAQRAYEAGFVNQVVKDGEQLEAALDLAQAIASCAPMVVRWLKNGVDNHVMPKSHIESALHTMVGVGKMYDSKDREEGFASFREKRKPVFQNK
ncbi:MAG: enoyl-CoA hydratase/isomerase family protein [Proteobacteria bacterium]|nr:enoyl-CoA hydratase/isomerase family protein [Pseudomonadota bacterium]